MTDTTPPRLNQLGEKVRQRREELGYYTVVEAARHAGVSRDTWAKIERGEPGKPVSYRKIEIALKWAAGSMSSGNPVSLTAADNNRAEELREISATLAQLLERVERLQRDG